MSNNKLYVGNLSPSTSEAELRQAFSPAGTVKSVNIVTDRATGSPRGFAFVEFENDEQAQAGIDKINMTDLGGQTLTVSVARQARARR